MFLYNKVNSARIEYLVVAQGTYDGNKMLSIYTKDGERSIFLF